MIRAAVFIGVDKTGNLQILKDAAAGARRMHDWALSQGITNKTHAKLITDSAGIKVDPDLIFDAIKEIIDGPGVDQLIIYFAGHGININRTEYWLLTDAPLKDYAAVNVSGSVDLARYSGIQHVVFISDACRVAPEGIQAQTVRGMNVFPNDVVSGRAKPVDQFFACLLGKTAAEIKDQDPIIAAQNYSALYTNALLDALEGTRPEVLEPAESTSDSSWYVKPYKLQSYLETEVPRRVKNLHLEKKVNQNPDAILSLGGQWLSRIEGPITPPVHAQRGVKVFSPGIPESLRSVSLDLMRSATEGNQMNWDLSLQQAGVVQKDRVEQLVNTVKYISAPFGPDHFESKCGIKVRGARIVDFFAPRIEAEILSTSGDILRVNALEDQQGGRINLYSDEEVHRSAWASSVLLRFDGNFGTVIPVIPGFIAALTFEDKELVDVLYEPSVNSQRWDRYKDRADQVRKLRAVAASSSQHGRFRLDQVDAIRVARMMQDEKGLDPTLAIYAAYAYYDQQEIGRIGDMSGYLHGDIGITFFDLALLSRTLLNKSISPKDGIVPFIPLLSQGWALLQGQRVRLHPALEGIERSMHDSLWSLFDPTGLEKITNAMQTKEVR